MAEVPKNGRFAPTEFVVERPLSSREIYTAHPHQQLSNLLPMNSNPRVPFRSSAETKSPVGGCMTDLLHITLEGLPRSRFSVDAWLCCTGPAHPSVPWIHADLAFPLPMLTRARVTVEFSFKFVAQLSSKSDQGLIEADGAGRAIGVFPPALSRGLTSRGADRHASNAA
ncbi:hypothetical protein JHW43_009529 [Diplocarpon mali]|nr:hypothetical protein JHW43_009529 [Diplocarpon mali]